jgi:hypothetical protein
VAIVPEAAAHHVVDVQPPARVLGADAAIVQCEHRPLRDDEQAAELREPRDDVVRERVGGPAPARSRSRRLRKGHHRNRCATCLGGRTVGDTSGRARRRAGRIRAISPARPAPHLPQGCAVEAPASNTRDVVSRCASSEYLEVVIARGATN